MDHRSHRGGPSRAGSSRRGWSRLRTRGLSLSIGVLGAVMLVAVAPAALAGMAASAPGDDATITFTDRNRDQACDSVPDVSSITIHGGDRVTLVNGTGVDTSLDAGQAAALIIADGDGASLRLKQGQHAIRLVPDCDTVGTVKPLVVTVSNDMTSEGASASPTSSSDVDDGGAPGSLPGTGGGSAPGLGGNPDGSPAGTSRARSQSTGGGGPDGAAAPTEAIDLEGDSGAIESITPVLAGKPDAKPTRLLAVIAVICVSGVTWAILRVILSQRTVNVIGT